MLDADGFEAFVEAGNPFDAAVAKRLFRFIYSSGNSIEPGAAYRAFRGRAPTPQPMLKQRGLVEEGAAGLACARQPTGEVGKRFFSAVRKAEKSIGLVQ